MRIKNRLSIIIIFFLFVYFVHSPNVAAKDKNDQQVEDIEDFSLEDLLNIQVKTATKVSLALEKSPATLIVITSRMIRDMGYHHLEEILHDLPGFDFDKSFGVNYSTIFMRGYRSANSDRFILLYDGILENDIWKQTNWISRQYPVTQIKQIEILYGPASALYGTNAFSGIINVITKTPEELDDITLRVDYGSWGRKNLEFTAAQQLNDKFSFSVTVKYFGADDLHPWDHMKLDFQRDFSAAYKDVFDAPYIYNNGKLEEGDINGSLPYDDYAIHANIYFGNFKFTALNWTKRELEGYVYSPFKRRGNYSQWYENNQGYRLSYQLNINEKATIESSLMYRSHRLLDSLEISQKYFMLEDLTFKMKLKSVEKGYGEVTYNNLNTSDLTFEEQLNYTFSDKVNIVTGLKFTYTDTQEDYNMGSSIEEIHFSPRHKKKNYGAFVQLMFTPGNKLSFTLGSRYERIRDENNDGYDIVTPRASMVYTASSILTFRLQYSEAFQEPDDWHKFALDIGIRDRPSPNLEPEKMRAIELGTTIKVSSGLLVFASVYYNVIDGLIVAVDDAPGAETYHWENLGTSKIFGYEMSFRAILSNTLSLNGNISGAFNRDENDEEIGDIAPVKANIGLMFKQRKFSVFAKVNYVSKKNTINHMLDPTVLPIVKSVNGYAIAGLNIRYLGIIKGLDLHLKLDNVFNTKYYNPGPRSADGYKYNAKILQPGINFMVGFTHQFKN